MQGVLISTAKQAALAKAEIVEGVRQAEALSIRQLGKRMGISKSRADTLVLAAIAANGLAGERRPWERRRASQAEAAVKAVKRERVEVPTSKPPPGMTTALYRPYDADGVLLYVGITDRLAQRRSMHRRNSSWSAFAVRTDLEWFADRQNAEAAEVAAIQAEVPLFNERHASPEAKIRLVEYLIANGRLDLLSPAVSRG